MVEATEKPIIINEKIFNFLRNFGWSQVPKNRYVALVFDMISIQDILPAMSEVDNFPTHALLFAVKVINGKGLQPFANVFLYESTPAWRLSDCIKAYITDLEKCELFVIATVCPPTEYLRSVIETLVERSTLQNKTDAHIYSVSNVKNIVHCYDAPSMLQEVCNYFVKSPVVYKQFGKQCCGNYKNIESLLKITTNKFLRVISEMKHSEEINKFATKLFSMSMSHELQNASNNGQIPDQGTANLCSFFDILFNSFIGIANCENVNGKLLSSFSLHNKIWNDAIPVLKSMKFLREQHIQKDENFLNRIKQDIQKKTKYNSDDSKLNISLVKEDKQEKINSPIEHLNENIFCVKENKYSSSSQRKINRNDDKKKYNFCTNKAAKVEKYNLSLDDMNVDGMGIGSSEVVSASSALETLANVQYLDMLLENIDKAMNDFSLIYKHSEDSPNIMTEQENQYFSLEAEDVLNDQFNNCFNNEGAEGVCRNITLKEIKKKKEREHSRITSNCNDKKQKKQIQINNAGKIRDPAVEKNNLTKIMFQVAEQLQRKGQSNSSCRNDEILYNDKDSKTTYSNTKRQSKKHDEHKDVDDTKNEGAYRWPKTKKINEKPKIQKKSSDYVKDEILSDVFPSNLNNKANVNTNLIDGVSTGEEVDGAANNDNELSNTDEAAVFKSKQYTHPYVLDAWIISINGMKEIYKILQQKRFENINTKEFNVDCVKYMLYKVKQANGVNHPCPGENGNYPVLDKDLVKLAFLSDASITLT